MHSSFFFIIGLTVTVNRTESFDSNSSSSQNITHSQPTSAHTTHPISKRHLAIIFFDVLALEGQSLLNTPFERRREVLEELIRRIPGWSGISSGEWIKLDHESENSQNQSQSQSRSQDSSQKPKLSSQKSLINTFSRSIASYQEGLVLKPCTGKYNCTQAQWVKMKKDYIPGLGDCADFVILGAGWEKERGRELGGKFQSRFCAFCFSESWFICSGTERVDYVLCWCADE